MNVLVVSSYYHPAKIYGGPVRSIRLRNKALAELGHKIRIFTTAANGLVDFPPTASQPLYVDGLPVTYFPRWWFGMNQKPFTLFFSPEMSRALRQIKPGDFDLMLIHSTWGDPGRMAANAARRTSTPYISYTHGSFEHGHMAYKKLKKQIYMTVVEAKILRRAAGIVVCNDSETKYLRTYGIRNTIRRIPWGVNIIDPNDMPPYCTLTEKFPNIANRPFILFLARLHPTKGLDTLIPAFAAIAEEFPAWRLVLAGPNEGGYRHILEKVVADYNLRDRVLFPGMVTGEAKAALLAHADLYVLPSYLEGFSISVAEALGYGRPVLITETCYVPEVKDYGAGLIVSPNLTSMIQAMRTLLENEDLRRDCSSNALRLAQTEFTWDAVAEKSLAFYREIMK